MVFWMAWLIVVVGVSVEWSVTFWGASYLQSKLRMDAGLAASLLAIYLFATLAGRLIGSRLARTVAGSRLLSLALGVTLLGSVTFWLAPGDCWTVVGLVVSGLGIANLWPQAIAQAFSISPQQSDRVSAWVSLGAGLASCVVPLWLGTLANQIGLNVAFGIVPCLATTALAINYSVSTRIGSAAPHPKVKTQ